MNPNLENKNRTNPGQSQINPDSIYIIFKLLLNIYNNVNT